MTMATKRFATHGGDAFELVWASWDRGVVVDLYEREDFGKDAPHPVPAQPKRVHYDWQLLRDGCSDARERIAQICSAILDAALPRAAGTYSRKLIAGELQKMDTAQGCYPQWSSLLRDNHLLGSDVAS
jgi:hypothetical protein